MAVIGAPVRKGGRAADVLAVSGISADDVFLLLTDRLLRDLESVALSGREEGKAGRGKKRKELVLDACELGVGLEDVEA